MHTAVPALLGSNESIVKTITIVVVSVQLVVKPVSSSDEMPYESGGIELMISRAYRHFVLDDLLNLLRLLVPSLKLSHPTTDTRVIRTATQKANSEIQRESS